MNQKTTLATILSVALLFSLVAGVQVVEVTKANFIPYGTVTIESPTNKTYTTNTLILNISITFSMTNNKTVEYSINGQPKVTITGLVYSGDILGQKANVTFPLPILSNGPHRLEVYATTGSSPVLPDTGYAVVNFVVDASGNPWTARTSLPTAIAGLEAAVANGEIYAFRSSITYENDPGGIWTTRSSMPTWRYNVAVASYQNKIYVIGGATNDSSPTGTNEAYDPANDSWKTMASMPTPRHSLDANVVNGKIYLIGGLIQHHLFPNDNGTYEATNVTEVYDPATNSWTTKTSVPNAVHNYASAVVNNKIYIISETLTQIYNPDNDSWSYGTPPPYSVDMAGCATTTGAIAPQRIYVIGGRESGLEANYNQIYDPATDSWSLGTPMPTGRYSLGVAAVNDRIYAFGGVTGAFVVTEQKDQNEQYNPLKDSIVPAPSPSISPKPSLSPSQSPSSTPSQSTSIPPRLNPTSSASPTQSFTPSASPSENSTSTPGSNQNPPLPQALIYGAVVAVVVIIVAAVAMFLLRKRRRSTK